MACCDLIILAAEQSSGINIGPTPAMWWSTNSDSMKDGEHLMCLNVTKEFNENSLQDSVFVLLLMET